MSVKCKKILFMSLAMLMLIQIALVECKPRLGRRHRKKGSFTGALAGSLTGLAVGKLLNSNKGSTEEHHYHYDNPPTYTVQSVQPVVVQQPMVPVYTQQSVVPVAVPAAPIAPVYQQQQPAAPVYGQQQLQPAAPVVYQQSQLQPSAPVYQEQPASVYPGNLSYPDSPIVYATNQSQPVSPIVSAINLNENVIATIPSVNLSYPVQSLDNNTHSATLSISINNDTVFSTMAPVAPAVPIGSQQYVPVIQQQQPVATVPMMPTAGQQPNVIVLSKKTGHYGRNSADKLLSSSYFALLILAILARFI